MNEELRIKRWLMSAAAALLLGGSGRATPLYFSALDMTGATNDITINVQPVNNPVIYAGQFYWLPLGGTNVTTTNGIGYLNLVPGHYTAVVDGIPQSWSLNVTNSANLVNAADLSSGVVFYSGVQNLTAGSGIVLTQPWPGNYVITASGGGGGGVGVGAGTNVIAVTNAGTVTISAVVGTNAVAAAQSNALAVATNSFVGDSAWNNFTNGAQAWSVYNLTVANFGAGWANFNTNILSTFLTVANYNAAWGNLSTNIFAGYATGAALSAGTNASNGYVNARLTSLTNGGSLFNNVIRQPVISFDTTATAIESDGSGGIFINFPGPVIPIQINGADFIDLGGVVECPSFNGGYYAATEGGSPGGFFSAVNEDFYGANDPGGDFRGNGAAGLTNIWAANLTGTASIGTLSNGLFLMGGNSWLTLSNGVMTLTNTVTHNYVILSNGVVLASGGFTGSGAGLTGVDLAGVGAAAAQAATNNYTAGMLTTGTLPLNVLPASVLTNLFSGSVLLSNNYSVFYWNPTTNGIALWIGTNSPAVGVPMVCVSNNLAGSAVGIGRIPNEASTSVSGTLHCISLMDDGAVFAGSGFYNSATTSRSFLKPDGFSGWLVLSGIPSAGNPSGTNNLTVFGNVIATNAFYGYTGINITNLGTGNFMIETNGNLTISGQFAGSGTGLTAVPAAQLTGNVPLAQLTNVFNGSTAVNGGGVTNLNATQLQGIIPSASLPSAGAQYPATIDAGAGTELSPYTNSDGAAGFQTLVNTAVTNRGVNIDMGLFRYDIFATNGINIQTPSVAIQGTTVGFNTDPNGEAEGTNGAKLRLSGQGIQLGGGGGRIGGELLRNFYEWGVSKNVGSNILGISFPAATGSCDQPRVENVNISDCYAAIYINNSVDAGYFWHLSILNNGYGIYATPSAILSYSKFDQLEISDNDQTGFYVGSSSAASDQWERLVNSTLVRDARMVCAFPANVWIGNNNAVLANDIVRDAGHFILAGTTNPASAIVLTGSNCIVSDCQIMDNSEGAGIRLQGDGHMITGDQFAGNLVDMIVENGTPTITGCNAKNIIWNTNAGPLTALTAWYRANELNLPNNVGVPVILDSSTNQNDLANITTTNQNNGPFQPLFLTNQIAGWPALSFTGTNKCLIGNAPTSPSTGDFALYSVIKVTGAGPQDNSRFWLGNLQNSGQFNGFNCGVDTSGRFVFNCRVAGASQIISNTVPLTNQWVEVTCLRTNGIGYIFTNGVQAASGSLAGDVTGLGLCLGQDRSSPSGENLNCSVAEVIMENTTVDRTNVEFYLTNKYGL